MKSCIDMARDMIGFGEDWCGLPSSTQHLIQHLAKTRKIVWVNSIGLRRPKLDRYDFKRLWAKLFAGKVKAKYSSDEYSMGDNFCIVNPKTLPAPRSRFGRWLSTLILKSQIKPVINKAKLNSPVLWISLPTAVDIVGKLGDSGLVYYCGDDFSALAGVDHQTVRLREKELVEKADLILAASEHLKLQFPPSKTQLLSHGVDYNLFSKRAPRADDLPDDGRPIAGFYGSISSWLDIELLQLSIAKLPDWHFIFIGKPVVDVSVLTRFPNVTLLGERPHHQLPSYSQYWTACLLPFINNDQIRACNPLKLYEYLATGRPIISTDFPAVSSFRGIIQIINNSESLVKALINSKHVANLESLSTIMRDTVNDKSWAARAQQVNRWIELI